MLTKEEYRQYFNYWKKYVRYSSILDELNIPRSNFSQFLNGKYENALSVDKLESIKVRMQDLFKELEDSKCETKAEDE